MASTQTAVKGIDLSRIIPAMRQRTGMSADMAMRAEDLYRKFLELRLKYPQQLLIAPKLVDEVWHTHIMDTEKYSSDCQAVFGKPLHHNPYFDNLDDHPAWLTTKKLYKQEFNIDLEPLGEAGGWGRCGSGG